LGILDVSVYIVN